MPSAACEQVDTTAQDPVTQAAALADQETAAAISHVCWRVRAARAWLQSNGQHRLFALGWCGRPPRGSFLVLAWVDYVLPVTLVR